MRDLPISNGKYLIADVSQCLLNRFPGKSAIIRVTARQFLQESKRWSLTWSSDISGVSYLQITENGQYVFLFRLFPNSMRKNHPFGIPLKNVFLSAFLKWKFNNNNNDKNCFVTTEQLFEGPEFSGGQSCLFTEAENWYVSVIKSRSDKNTQYVYWRLPDSQNRF